MPKKNLFTFEGTVSEISEPKFLQNGAEVRTIVLDWADGEYQQTAAFDFYSKKGLDKLNALNIAVGDSVTIPASPSSKVKEGTSGNGPWRFWQTSLRGDSWGVSVVSRADGGGAPEKKIEFYPASFPAPSAYTG